MIKPLPPQYSWLAKEPGPKMLLAALKYHGLREVKGKSHNPEILSWAKEIGGPVAAFYNADEIAWCGLFMAVCAKRAGKPIPSGYDALRALKWARWGTPTNRPMLGDILVFKREGGGHVGLYVGEDPDCFHVLGGNQGDAVSIVRIDKLRLDACRQSPWKIGRPKNVRRVFLNPTGTISKNEA